RERHDQAESFLRQAEQLTARPHYGHSAPRAPQLPSLNQWLLLGVVAMASLLILTSLGGENGAIMSRWGSLLNLSAAQMTNRTQLFGAAHTAGDYQLQGVPTITAQQIDTILAAYGSPATGTGATWYNLGLKYGIDPAFAVAFFIHESSAGTHPGWAGWKADGTSTHNVGNIICAGYATCYGRFRDYSSWDEGIEDWYRLIDVEYIKGRGTLTVQDIVPIYAPSFENDVQAYINAVTSLVDQWRTNGVQ
ncbi:MAG: glucosaminidase domain-containing protein, partial [Oscillochloris sp.]|nr:glucosaminidase domain-containing protein [Oscillochloris sp.]